MNYYIYQDNRGFTVIQYPVYEYKWSWLLLESFPEKVSDQKDLKTFKTLKQARKYKEKLEIADGRIVDMGGFYEVGR